MELRRGMWVRLGSQTGIYLGTHTKGAEVHLTNDKGETTSVVLDADPKKLRQAKLSEIPKPRRPDADAAKRFGYV